MNGNGFLHTFFRRAFCAVKTLTKGRQSNAMQHVSTQTIPLSYRPIGPSSRGGGRIASVRYRQSLAQSDEFTGLEEGTNRYELLLLVKKIGKHAAFSSRMIHLLDYYMAYTREVDWEEGSRPVVYQSLAKTALDMGVSERQIQKLEQQLFIAGAITWNDSGNHRRYGQRDATTGRIVYAYGIDLTPLAYLREELEQKLLEKQLRDQAWLATKREISWDRRQIRSLLAEWSLNKETEEGASADAIRTFDGQYGEIAIQLRTHLDLETMRSLLARHKSLYEEIAAAMGVGGDRKEKTSPAASIRKETHKGSSRSVSKFAHSNYSNQLKNNCSPKGPGFQKNVAAPSQPHNLILATGLQHISLKQVLLASSERFRAHLPLEPRPMNWNDVTEAAYRLRTELGISQASWGEACELLGRNGASICVLLTDQATQRSENAVSKPGAYFRSLIRKGRTGELRLHNSVFGLLDRNGL